MQSLQGVDWMIEKRKTWEQIQVAVSAVEMNNFWRSGDKILTRGHGPHRSPTKSVQINEYIEWTVIHVNRTCNKAFLNKESSV